MNKLAPIKMIPAYKDYLWGGERLVDDLSKKTDVRPLAESWEISCHPEGDSIAANGFFKGTTLREIIKEHPQFVGKGHKGDFPVLIKFIDAKQSLSLQVHPNNDYAFKNENQPGKNEMWYVVDALPKSKLVMGFREKLTGDLLEERILDNTILDYVNYIEVKAGDCFEIPAGMLHAIGAGCLVAEVQQSSNVTYRVYDYDRRDAGGNPRELHIKPAIDVIDTSLQGENLSFHPQVKENGYSYKNLTNWEWFNTTLYQVEESLVLNCDDSSFNALTMLAGQVTLQHQGEEMPLSIGESVFVPAGAGEYSLTGSGKLLLVSI